MIYEFPAYIKNAMAKNHPFNVQEIQ